MRPNMRPATRLLAAQRGAARRQTDKRRSTPPRAISPTIGGPLQVQTDERVHGVPRGSEVIIRRGAFVTAAYVLDPSGGVHVLIAEGEIPLPPRLQQEARERYFGGRERP